MLISLDEVQPSVRFQDRLGYVYHTIFTRPTDGKKFHYVGQHRARRLDRRYAGSGFRLRAMFDRYGRNGNTYLCVIGWASSQDELNLMEIEFIKQVRRLYGAACLNLAHGGESSVQHPLTRQKISAALTGIKRSKATRRKLRDAQTGKRHSRATREKMAAAKLGVTRPAETGRRISESKMGHAVSPDTRALLSKIHTGRRYPRVECPHCAKVIASNMANYFHFDNCKIRPIT